MVNLSYNNGSYIIQQNNNTPVGTIGYRESYKNQDFPKALEIWYQIHPDYRKKGFASQSVIILINHLFLSLPINRIQASVVEANTFSIKVLEKAGMIKEGLLRGIYYLKGKYVDYLSYSILREDWGDEKEYLNNSLT